MVHKWYTEFRCGSIRTSDAERPVRQKEVTFQEMFDKSHDVVLNDRRLKVHEINEIVKISVGRVWHILNECLGMRKLSARWVPLLLTADHKRARVVASNTFWACFNVIQRNFGDVM